MTNQKRKAQNRAAQRAFRERKERHVKDLEAKVAALEETTAKMADENSRLKHRLAKLESENNILKGSNITFTFPVLPLPRFAPGQEVMVAIRKGRELFSPIVRSWILLGFRP